MKSHQWLLNGFLRSHFDEAALDYNIDLKNGGLHDNVKYIPSQSKRQLRQSSDKLFGSYCVKSVHIRSFCGSHYPAFGLNTERYSAPLHIQSECGKIRTSKTPNTNAFHAVFNPQYSTNVKTNFDKIFASLANILTSYHR